jgi:hypothetical protein
VDFEFTTRIEEGTIARKFMIISICYLSARDQDRDVPSLQVDICGIGLQNDGRVCEELDHP